MTGHSSSLHILTPWPPPHLSNPLDVPHYGLWGFGMEDWFASWITSFKIEALIHKHKRRHSKSAFPEGMATGGPDEFLLHMKYLGHICSFQSLEPLSNFSGKMMPVWTGTILASPDASKHFVVGSLMTASREPDPLAVYGLQFLPNRVGPSTNFDVDNGVVQVIPRMRDLQDFGLQGTDSKANKTRPKNVFKAHSVEDGIQIVNEGNILRSNLQGASVTEDGNNKMESCITRITSGVCSAPSVSKTSLSIVQKRKKHPTSSSADESSHKKRDRRRPLTQVLKKSSNKVATLGCETSAFPSSTTDCQIRVFCSDGTEATSSQDAFKQAIDESRPSSEQGDFYLQPTDHHSIYGLKQDRSRPLTHSDTALTSFWSNYWDSGDKICILFASCGLYRLRN
ncbi:hypothetical protein GOP47_0018076 [Adiantum capillus-veneris]|uniref:Uncharacterized protein n=1 Tax=Adiantum capillus-veneris TaxID=13818 RepID=A0A9D4UHJ6_ADICA|nr:hypothetical protein GOP47_0018076 [Adiantum capillus-veneris]